MTAQRRHTADGRRRGPAFSLRQTVLAFGLAAALLCGAGLALRSFTRAAGEYGPLVLVVAALAVIAFLVAVVRSRRRSRMRTARWPAAHPEVPHAREPLGAEPLATAPVHPAPAESALVEPETEPVERARLAPEPTRAEPFAPEPFAPEPYAPADPEPAGHEYAYGDEYEPEPGPASGPVDFGSMDPLVFEQAVAALCERDGCRDVEVNGGAGDLGADVTAIAPSGLRVVIQCKRYGPVNKVGSQDTQRFGGTCFAVHAADVAAIVTTGEFTQPAADYAAECGIHCFDHRALAAWADGTGPAPWEATVPERPTTVAAE